MVEVESPKLTTGGPTEGGSDAIVDCLRVSVTDRCNMRCVYCVPPEGIRRARHHDILRFEEIVTVVRFLRDHYGLRTVRLTGGDPLVRPHIVKLVEMLAQLGIGDLAMTTNGQRLSALARPLREAGVDRVNISLDSLDGSRFARLTRGGQLDRTLAGIEAAKAAGFQPVKINTVVLRGENDSEVCDLVRFAMAGGLEIRFLELMAIGIAAETHGAWYVSSGEVLGRLKNEFRMVAVETVNREQARIHIAEDAQGRTARVGFISPESQPFCAACRRLRLTSDGRLLSCLMHSSGPDLRPFLRSGGNPPYGGYVSSAREAHNHRLEACATTEKQENYTGSTGILPVETAKCRKKSAHLSLNTYYGGYAGLAGAVRACLARKPAVRAPSSGRLMSGIGG